MWLQAVDRILASAAAATKSSQAADADADADADDAAAGEGGSSLAQVHTLVQECLDTVEAAAAAGTE